MSSPKHWYLLRWNYCFSPFIFVCFDVGQVKICVCIVRIFSVQQDTCSSVIWGPAATGQWKSCYVASFRTLDSANNASQTLFSLAWNIMGDVTDTSTQRTRQGHFFARFGYLEHTLGSYYARWNGLSRTETSQSVHKLWSKVITLAQNAPARLNQMFVVWTQPSHSLVLHPSDKPQTFKKFKTF